MRQQVKPGPVDGLIQTIDRVMLQPSRLAFALSLTCRIDDRLPLPPPGFDLRLPMEVREYYIDALFQYPFCSGLFLRIFASIQIQSKTGY